MKSYLSFLYCFLFIMVSGTASAQINIKFEAQKQRLHRDKDADKIYSIKMDIVDHLKDTKITIKNTNKGNAVVNKDYLFINQEFLITKGISEISTTITIKKADKKKQIDTAILILSYVNLDGDKKDIEDTVLMANIYKEDEEIKPGTLSNQRFALGHSFDFFDRDNPFLSYGKVNFFLPGIIEKIVGFDITFYQTRVNYVDSTLRTGGQATALEVLPAGFNQVPVNDSIYFKRNVYNRKINTNNNNYGLNLGFIFNTTGASSGTRTTGTDVYLMMNLEFIYRKFQYDYNYTLTDSITLKLPKTYPLRNDTYVKQLKKESFETYASGGLMIRNTTDPLEATIKINFGWLITEDYDSPILREGAFYSLDLEFIEKITKLNLTLGGQVRNFTTTSKPVFNVYLSKTFTLEKLKDFLLD